MPFWLNHPVQTQADFIERWEQALRVLQGVQPETLRMFSWATCLAGRCGRDPWFRERGFIAEYWPAPGLPLYRQPNAGTYFPGYSPVSFFGLLGWNVVLLNASLDWDSAYQTICDLLDYLRAGGDPFAEWTNLSTAFEFQLS